MSKLEEVVAERDRLRDALKRIADHHDEQRMLWENGIGDGDNARYHEDRRNFALFHLTNPVQRIEK